MRITAPRIADILTSAFLVVTIAIVVVWSVLLNATDIIAGVLDQTGATRRSH